MYSPFGLAYSLRSAVGYATCFGIARLRPGAYDVTGLGAASSTCNDRYLPPKNSSGAVPGALSIPTT
jgi:hypothetical protein